MGATSSGPDDDCEEPRGEHERAGASTGGGVVRLRKRRGAPSAEHCEELSPSEAMIGALDAALLFTASRELLTAGHVRDVFALLDASSPVARDPGPVSDALQRARGALVGHGVVSGTEITDRLLDVRLVARAPGQMAYVSTRDPLGAGAP
jgi:hypothetical protein